MVNEVLEGEHALKKELKQLEKENELLRFKLNNVSHTHLTMLMSLPPSLLHVMRKREVNVHMHTVGTGTLHHV